MLAQISFEAFNSSARAWGVSDLPFKFLVCQSIKLPLLAPADRGIAVEDDEDDVASSASMESAADDETVELGEVEDEADVDAEIGADTAAARLCTRLRGGGTADTANADDTDDTDDEEADNDAGIESDNADDADDDDDDDDESPSPDDASASSAAAICCSTSDTSSGETGCACTNSP